MQELTRTDRQAVRMQVLPYVHALRLFQLLTLIPGVVDQPLNEVRAGGTDHRCDVAVLLRSTHAQLAHVSSHARHKLVSKLHTGHK
jgi:hypothetical protein